MEFPLKLKQIFELVHLDKKCLLKFFTVICLCPLCIHLRKHGLARFLSVKPMEEAGSFLTYPVSQKKVSVFDLL